jgi:fimbrial chaperone protein
MCLRKPVAALLACIPAGWAAPGLAASLQVSPVSFNLPANVKAAQFTMQNLGDAPIEAQIRVFRWSQQNGEDQLTPTADVVASPPAASLAPHQDYVVRLVRIAEKPADGEESYRLLVDELPPPLPSNNLVSNIRFLVRYSVPVFFAQPDTSPQLAWSASLAGGHVSLTLRNDGSQHVRISALKVEGSSGASVSFGEGLAGYALAHSSVHWTSQAAANNLAPGAVIKITAQGDNGPVSATIVLQTPPN